LVLVIVIWNSSHHTPTLVSNDVTVRSFNIISETFQINLYLYSTWVTSCDVKVTDPPLWLHSAVAFFQKVSAFVLVFSSSKISFGSLLHIVFLCLSFLCFSLFRVYLADGAYLLGMLSR
jgi:hypothetical protein